MIVNPRPGANFVLSDIVMTLSLTPLQKQRAFFLKFFENKRGHQLAIEFQYF